MLLSKIISVEIRGNGRDFRVQRDSALSDKSLSIDRFCPSPLFRAIRYGINPKTVAKWRKRAHVTDARMGPKEVPSTVLSVEEEAAVVAFRRHTLLPLDDCLYALQASIPHLTRSSLHRCLQRDGISRLPQLEESKTRSKFKQYPIGYFHIDIAEVRTEEGKLYLFVAIDRTSKFAYAELHAQSDRTGAVAFLRSLIKVVPYKIHTLLTDNGVQFCHPPRYRNGPTAKYIAHMFDLCCHEWHRAPPDKGQPSLDQWSGRTYEPDHQGSNHQALPLRFT